MNEQALMHDGKIKKSLRMSLLDGIFANIMSGFSDSFIIPYALALSAGVRLIGFLASMPGLIAALLQLSSAALVERLGSRKSLITRAVFIHALMWAPIILIPYVFEHGYALYFVLFYTLSAAFGTLSVPAWSSLMSDHVPETERGKVFGWRNKVFGIIQVGSMFTAGLILHLLKNAARPPSSSFSALDSRALGFTIIFSVAMVSRFVSWHFLTRMYEPKLVIRDEHRFTLIDFLKRIRRSNFGRFVLFVASMNFAVQIAAPFFAVYMLRDLGFSYMAYTVINISATITSIVSMNRWGAYADHAGNRRILRLTSLFIPFIPMLWIFSHNIAYLICIQIFAGFFWAGFNLAATNFIYDAVMPQKRMRCIAYFNVINGIAIFLGANMGGYLVKAVPPIFGYQILTVLVISGALRFFSALIFAYVKEVRKVKEMSSMELFYNVITRRNLIGFSAGKE